MASAKSTYRPGLQRLLKQTHESERALTEARDEQQAAVSERDLAENSRFRIEPQQTACLIRPHFPQRAPPGRFPGKPLKRFRLFAGGRAQGRKQSQEIFRYTAGRFAGTKHGMRPSGANRQQSLRKRPALQPAPGSTIFPLQIICGMLPGAGNLLSTQKLHHLRQGMKATARPFCAKNMTIFPGKKEA
jgi:hypothetical protein